MTVSETRMRQLRYTEFMTLPTLIETAKLNGVDPQVWFNDVLGRIAEYKITMVDELLLCHYIEIFYVTTTSVDLSRKSAGYLITILAIKYPELNRDRTTVLGYGGGQLCLFVISDPSLSNYNGGPTQWRRTTHTCGIR
jgi:hypothetical protein